jgi:hypothetical protein
MDPWSLKDVTGNLLASPAKEAAMIAALVSTDMQFMLNSGTYLAGKPVLDFGEIEAGRRLEEEQLHIQRANAYAPREVDGASDAFS